MLKGAPDAICASPYGLGSDRVRTPSTVNAVPGSKPVPVALGVAVSTQWPERRRLRKLGRRPYARGSEILIAGNTPFPARESPHFRERATRDVKRALRVAIPLGGLLEYREQPRFHGRRPACRVAIDP